MRSSCHSATGISDERAWRPISRDPATFEAWQEGICVASCTGPRIRSWLEVQHYARMFGQDGAVEIFEVAECRRRVGESDA